MKVDIPRKHFAKERYCQEIQKLRLVSDERVTPETTAFQCLKGGYFTSSTQLEKKFHQQTSRFQISLVNGLKCFD